LGKRACELGDEQMFKRKLVATEDFINEGEQFFSLNVAARKVLGTNEICVTTQ